MSALATLSDQTVELHHPAVTRSIQAAEGLHSSLELMVAGPFRAGAYKYKTNTDIMYQSAVVCFDLGVFTSSLLQQHVDNLPNYTVYEALQAVFTGYTVRKSP